MGSTIKYFVASQTPNTNAGPPSSTSEFALAYSTYGDPKNPAILMPSCFGGLIENTLSFLYQSVPSKFAGSPPTESPVLDQYFIIITNLLGGSESSSPSNAHPSIRGTKFPQPSYADNINLQKALLDALGVKHLFAAIGFSMGGQQVYHMAAMYPDFVDKVIVLASSARTSWHNKSFLDGPKSALENSIDFNGGNYGEKGARQGTAAFGRVYSTWCMGIPWFRARSWEKLGFETMEEYLLKSWENGGCGIKDANDLLCMLRTWRAGDISLVAANGEKGKLENVLGSLKAKVLLMPSRTDLYFPPEDSEIEMKSLKHGQLKVIESIWGHAAGGGGGSDEDIKFISTEVKRFLDE